MLSFLKDHPFAVEAFFESSVVLTFALPKEKLQQLIPGCLELDTLNNQWAFLAVAMVQTKALRPKGFPKMFGNNFFLIGYRLFVKYIDNKGKRLRGLYILKSETDKKKMEFLGNIFTHYQYTTTDITQTNNNGITEITSTRSGLHIAFEQTTPNIPLPPGSPFIDWKEARRFAGPLPFTFTYQPGKNKVLIIEGVRQHWFPKPINVTHCHVSFLASLHLSDAVLANAFIIQNIPYYWKKGKTEQWHKQENPSTVFGI